MKTVKNFDEFLEGANQILGLAGQPPRYYKVTSIEVEGAPIDKLLRDFKDLHEIDITAFERENQYREKLFALAVKDPKAFLIARDKHEKAVGYLTIFGFRNDRLLRDLEAKDQYNLDIPDLLDYFNDIVARKDWNGDPVHIYIDALAIKGTAGQHKIVYPRAHLILLQRLIVDSVNYNTPVKSISTIAVNEQGMSLAKSLIGLPPVISRKTVKKQRYLFVRRFEATQPLSNWLPELIKKALRNPGEAAKVIGVLIWLAAIGWKIAHGMPFWDP